MSWTISPTYPNRSGYVMAAGLDMFGRAEERAQKGAERYLLWVVVPRGRSGVREREGCLMDV